MDEVSKLKVEVANLNYKVYQLTCALNRRTYELECAAEEEAPHSKMSESGVCVEPYCGWPYHTHALMGKNGIQEVKAVPVETVKNLVTALREAQDQLSHFGYPEVLAHKINMVLKDFQTYNPEHSNENT